jgi:hypothetical protein
MRRRDFIAPTGAAIALRLRTAAALGVLFGLAWPVLALEPPSTVPTSTKQPGFHFTRSQPGVREAYIVSFGLFGGESVFESEARGAAQILSARLPKAQSLELQHQEGWGSNAAQPSIRAQSSWRGDGWRLPGATALEGCALMGAQHS